MERWHKFSKPPQSALRKIGAGRLKGKSDINPQWRYQAMTEVYGECGIGWKWEIDKLWTEQGSDGQVFAFAMILLYTKNNDGWSESIPGVGGEMLIVQEKSGLYNNDEAFKMAITDALGTAMKMLGVAAEVYLGNYDGSKYLTPDHSHNGGTVCAVFIASLESTANMAELKMAWEKITLNQGFISLPDIEKMKVREAKDNMKIKLEAENGK